LQDLLLLLLKVQNLLQVLVLLLLRASRAVTRAICAPGLVVRLQSSLLLVVGAWGLLLLGLVRPAGGRASTTAFGKRFSSCCSPACDV
jgi:hypothetical protein